MEFNWQSFLEQFSQSLLADDNIRAQQSQETLHSRWLGFPGASPEEIRTMEERLGIEIPLSYRRFLQTSNGWRNSGSFIHRVWSVHEIDWFKEHHQQWIDAYIDPKYKLPTMSEEDYHRYGEAQDPTSFRAEYLQSALQISDVGDSAVYLLNPRVVTNEGEWEAWFFANWLPGAARYRSFQELMEAEYRNFLALSR